MDKNSPSYLLWLMATLLLLAPSCQKRRDLTKIAYLEPLKSLSDGALMVVFSSSIEGYVKSCGCTSAPLGDIARFAQIFEDIKSLRGEASLLFIDSGNLLFDMEKRNAADLCQDDARLAFLLSTLKEMGLAQTIVGPFDDARGSAYRQNLYEKMGLKAFSEVLGERIVEINNQRIGLIGVKEGAIPENTQKMVKQMQTKKPNLIIALSQMPKAVAKEFFKDISAIDVVIQGQTSSFAPTRPEKLSLNGPLFIEGGRQENYFTLLVGQQLAKRGEEGLIFDDRAYNHSASGELIKSRLRSLKSQAEGAPESRQQFLQKRIFIAETELKELKNSGSFKPLAEPSLLFLAIATSKNVDPLTQVQTKLDAYEKSIPLLVTECEKNIVCPQEIKGEATYVGASSCKACHAEAYEVWQKALYFKDGQDEQGKPIKRQMGHSKAWQTLVEAKKDQDRSCIGCHSIGFMKPGGYCKVSDVGFRKDVQCESCHGPGSLHAKSGNKDFIKLPTEKTCRECHHVPHIESYDSFNYNQRLAKILGPGHGARLLKELEHKAKEGFN